MNKPCLNVKECDRINPVKFCPKTSVEKAKELLSKYNKKMKAEKKKTLLALKEKCKAQPKG